MAQPPPSSSSSPFSYDVFLSFRGEDTRYGFTGNLYHQLCQRGIRTFFDDGELQGGDSIKPSLVKAIENSRTAIIVFSKNYASSSFCLDELVNIICSINDKGRWVFPIFYDLDPSDVRHQRGSYQEALIVHEERFKDDTDKLQNWRKALSQAADLSGYHFKLGDGYEYQFIERIIKDVSNKINPAPLHVGDCPVGMDSRVLKVMELLDITSDRVHMVGIHGIGGIGKTTLAWAVYNSIAVHFESVCFLEHVRKFDLRYLQDMLLSKLTGKKDIIFTSVREGISEIKKRLRQKKVLLILDDVNLPEQLRDIVGGPDWFGPGSRVIITTRDKPLLASHGVKRMYEVDGLNKTEALELFRRNAFKNNVVPASFEYIINRAVTYASGLPLALEIIGSNLFGKSVKEWKSALDRYERIPNEKIQKILKVSFDALKEDEQSVFLDIACCFKGYQLVKIEDILHAHHGDCMTYHIGELVEKSLIKIKDGEVTLHDLIEDMGKEIVRQESPNEHGKRSRLWFHDEIVQVLEDNTGTSNIETIYLHFPEFEGRVNWDGKALKKMTNLKTLIIRNGHFSEGPEQLPKSLRVLEWWGFPSLSLPSNFDPTKLALFRLPGSSLKALQLPKSPKVFLNLRVLDFRWCKFITKIHDVSAAPNLEEISFEGCENLIKIDKSVGFLHKLRILDAFGCRKLMSFPSLKECLFLRKLNLSWCMLLQEIRGIPPNIESFQAEYCTSLKQLDLRFLPACTEECSFLRRLILDCCRNLQEIRGIPSNLEFFSAVNCKALTPQCRSTLMKEVLHEAGVKEFCLPGTRIPEWFEHKSTELPISFWFRNKLPAISLCFVARHSSYYSLECHRLELIINGEKMSSYVRFFCRNDHIVIFDLKRILLDYNVDKVLLENEWNHVFFTDSDSYHYRGGQRVSKPDSIHAGLHVLEQKCSMEDIRFYDPYSISAIFGGGSSSFISPFTYDVCICFQGVDYCSNFTDKLNYGLRERGLRTFIDDKHPSSLITAIEHSMTAIIVFCKNYASSSFCLDALVHIIACIKDKGRLVLPVFYDVDPSDVRHQRGSYQEAFARHEESFKDDTEKLQKWRKALRQAADLSGYHLKLRYDEYEHEFIQRIIKAVYNEVSFDFRDADGLVVMESRVIQVMELLDISSDGVHMVGIHGIGGIGKTTLSDAVFKLIAHHFDSCCFLPNVRIESNEKGLEYLQGMLLSHMVGETIELKSVDEGISMIQQMLYKKKVLLILDDIDKIEQLEAMVGESSWFGPGSRVIITTRDKQLLASHGVERTYEVCEQYLPSTIKQKFESCESVNEAKEKGMVECNTNDGEDNGWSPVMKLLPMTKLWQK